MTREEKEMLTRCPVCFGGNIISDPLHQDDCLCLDCGCAFTAKFTEAPVYGYHTGNTDGDNINEVHYEEVENPEYKNVKEPNKDDILHKIDEHEKDIHDLYGMIDDLRLEVYLLKRLLQLEFKKGEK